MNTDSTPQKSSRYEKLAKPKQKVDKNNNAHPYKIKPSALSYQITDTLNKLAQPKRRTDSANAESSSTSRGNTERAPTKQKLINSNEHSRSSQDQGRRKYSDTYARITASTKNRCCSKRIRNLGANKRQTTTDSNYGRYDNDTVYRTAKTYTPKANVSFGNQMAMRK